MFCLIEISPLLVTDGSRPTLRACNAQDRRLTGAGGERWLPAITKAPSLGLKLFDGDFTSDVDPGSAQFTVKLDILALSGVAMGSCRWAGASVTIMSATIAGGVVTSETAFKGTISDFQIQANALQVTATVDSTPFDANALTETYAGTGGAEGGADLKGKLKPWLFGRAMNVEPVLIDQDNSILQFSAYGAIEAVNALYERGSSFGASVGDYADYDALVAGDIPAGRWGTCLAEGMVRLGAPPYGVITGDVDGDAVGGNWLRHTGAIIKRVALNAGVDLADIDTDSLDALDTAVPFPVNIVLTEQESVLSLAQRMIRPCNAQAGVSWLGQLFAARIAFNDAIMTLDGQGRRLPAVTQLSETTVSAPYKRIQMGAAQCWRVQTFDEIAFDATLIDVGNYDADTTYREGNIVELADGSRWLYTAATPAKGHAPQDGSAYWSKLTGATTVDWSSGVTGPGKPADDATNSADPGSPFGDGGETVGSVLGQLANTLQRDLNPPGVPAGLAMTSVITRDTDGTQHVKLIATWTASTADDLAGYVFALQDPATGQFVMHTLGPDAARYEEIAIGNASYTGKVQAFDWQGNFSDFSAPVTITTTKDTAAPGLASGFAALAAIGSIFLYWTNPADVDLAKAELWEGTSSNSAAATRIAVIDAAPGSPGGYTRSGTPTGQTRYYWIKERDTSGNVSGFSAVASAAPAQAVAADIADGSLVASKLAAGAVDATKIASGLSFVENITGSLPTTGNYEGRTATFGGKLYRYTSGAWTSAVPTGDLTGTITSAQINDNAITQAKIAANAVGASQIIANAIDQTKIASGLTLPKILTSLGDSGAEGQIGTYGGKLYRYTGGAWFASVATTDLTGYITAAQIAANTITAAQIAAGTITAAQIATGAITANKLVLADFSNLIDDPGFENGGGSWNPYGQASIDTIAAPNNGGSKALHHAANGTIIDTYYNPLFPCKPGDTYYAECWIKTAGVSSGTIQLAATCLMDTTTTSYPTVQQVSAASITPGVWTKLSGVLTIPANCNQFRLRCTTKSDVTGGDVYFDDVVLRKTASAELIVDGSITASKIAADTITAAQIAAATITSAQIAVGSITAESLAVGTLGSNLVGNPGAEVDTSGWYVAETNNAGCTLTSTQTTFFGGASSFAITKTATGNSSDWGYRAIPVTPGKTYSFHVAFKGSAASANGVYLRLNYGASVNVNGVVSSSTRSGAYDILANAAATTSWQEAVNTWTCPAGVRWVSPCVYNHAGGPITLYFDDVWFKEQIVSAIIANGAVSAQHIAANTITAAQIAANTITAAQIAAGTITGSLIAADTITASKLVIADTTNLIVDSNFDDTSGYWTINNFVYSNLSGALGPLGATACLVSPSGNGSTSQADAIAYTPLFNVEANGIYRISYSCQINAGFTGVVFVQAIWYNSAGTTLSGQTLIASDNRTSAAPTTIDIQPSVQITAPSTAATCRLFFYCRWSTTINNGSICVIANPRMQRSANGDLIVDGSIIASKIAALAVDASKIQAGTITSTQIASATITGDRIAAATIAGTNIQAGAISTNLLAAQAVTAAKIQSATITSTQIAAGTIQATNLAAGIITTSYLAAGAVTASKIASATITAAQIAAGTITGNLIAAGAVTADKITVGSATGGRLELINNALKTYDSSNVLRGQFGDLSI